MWTAQQKLGHSTLITWLYSASDRQSGTKPFLQIMAYFDTFTDTI